MSRISLVTGGAGFIGSHLVEALAKDGQQVRVLDDFSTGQRGNLAAIQPSPEIIEGDLSDTATVRSAMRDVEIVYHLGAIASVQQSIEDPLTSHRVAATGSLQVLEAARQNGARRLVYAGSASAYGIPAGPVQTEDDPLCPLSPYAAAKLAGEFHAAAYTAAFGLETVRLRFFNIFGPRQRADSPYSGVIAIFLARMSEGRRPLVFGDGLQSRDFTYVSDVVQALRKAAVTPGIAGRVYNVGTGASVSLLDLLAALNQLLGTNLVAEHGPDRAGDIRHSRADITRLRHELGYEPSTTFLQGLEETLRWYRSH